MERQKAEKRMAEFSKDLKQDLIKRAVVMPAIFVVITIIACLVLSNPSLNIFPNGNDTDVKITTAIVQDNSLGGTSQQNE